MSHFISVQGEVEEAFFNNAPAWHRLGQVVNGTVNSEEAIVAAHLGWEVEKQNLFQKKEVGDKIIYDETEVIVNVRTDIQRVLGKSSGRYGIVQNREAFKFMDSLVQNGNMTYESAGALKNGEYVWLLAKFPEDYKLTDEDVHRKYVLLMNSHNGKSCLQILPTDIRVVCWNTMSMALASEDNKFTMRHSGDMGFKLDECREMLGVLDGVNQQVNEIYEKMANRKVEEEALVKYIDKIFPYQLDKEERLQTRTTKSRNQILDNFEMPDTSASKSSVYGLLNATTKYFDHQWGKGRSDDKRMESLTVGAGFDKKNLAYDLCKEMVGV